MTAVDIENLLYFAKRHLGLTELDELYARNLIYRETGIEGGANVKADVAFVDSLTLPDALVAPLVEHFLAKGCTPAEAEEKAIYCMGVLTPRPSAVDAKFHDLYAHMNPEVATEYLYDLAVSSYYVMKSKVDRNIVFPSHFGEGAEIDISINLSKPEKNNKDIAKLLSAPAKVDYPACMLCKENLGYKGGGKIPPRETLRFVTLNLDGEKWFLQYSPYGYFARHIIVFSEHHANMVIDRRAISHLLSFVDLFPHMFLGSNADLPIVGGSILNHEHFQGGLPVLPLFKAKKSKEFAISAPNVKLYELDFYNTALLLESKSKKDLLDAVEKLRLAWNDYDDPERDILSHSAGQRHSTITPIARKMGDTYQLYVLLRNNRTSNAYPEGIFHAHPEYFHIKQEGIGLIEASGLFVLPARLVRQSKTLQEAVASGKSNFEIAEEYPELASFFPFADALREGKSKEEYLASVCREILKNTAVFKKDEVGQEGLKQFLERSGL